MRKQKAGLSTTNEYPSGLFFAKDGSRGDDYYYAPVINLENGKRTGSLFNLHLRSDDKVENVGIVQFELDRSISNAYFINKEDERVDLSNIHVIDLGEPFWGLFYNKYNRDKTDPIMKRIDEVHSNRFGKKQCSTGCVDSTQELLSYAMSEDAYYYMPVNNGNVIYKIGREVTKSCITELLAAIRSNPNMMQQNQGGLMISLGKKLKDLKKQPEVCGNDLIDEIVMKGQLEGYMKPQTGGKNKPYNHTKYVKTSKTHTDKNGVSRKVYTKDGITYIKKKSSKTGKMIYSKVRI